MDLLDLVQWPAMAVTVSAGWLVASRRAWRRTLAFWLFLASNALWIAWGWHARAWALVVLQAALAAMNVRGVRKNEDAPPGEVSRTRAAEPPAPAPPARP